MSPAFILHHNIICKNVPMTQGYFAEMYTVIRIDVSSVSCHFFWKKPNGRGLQWN